MISSHGFSKLVSVTLRVVPPLVPGSLTFHHFFNPDSIRIQCTFASPSPPAKASVPPPAFDHHNVVVLRSRRRGRSVQTRPPRRPSFHLENVGRKHLKRLKKLKMPSTPQYKRLEKSSNQIEFLLFSDYLRSKTHSQGTETIIDFNLQETSVHRLRCWHVSFWNAKEL